MKISADIKLEIQTFVYFLFKGTYNPKLIHAKYDYLDKLLSDKDLIYNCFEIFSYYAQNSEIKDLNGAVTEYIIELHDEATKVIDLKRVKEHNSKTKTYWKDFLTLSKWFCYNEFPVKINAFNLKDLNGCGTDAVPVFSIWTNVVEIDTSGLVINSEYALQRANDRLKLWDNVKPLKPFSEWELEQEIY